jgi:hypothetical protein
MDDTNLTKTERKEFIQVGQHMGHKIVYYVGSYDLVVW